MELSEREKVYKTKKASKKEKKTPTNFLSSPSKRNMRVAMAEIYLQIFFFSPNKHGNLFFSIFSFSPTFSYILLYKKKKIYKNLSYVYSYGISDGDNDSLFRIDLETGELKVIGFLDREKESEYLLNVTVYDLGKPQKSVSRLLPITVLDENDCYPIFEKSLVSLHVPESALNGFQIFHFNATDKDEGLNGKVTYSLVTETSQFTIDRETGILSISAPLDREKQDLYELRVRATDGGNKGTTNDGEFPSLSSEAQIQIKIDDYNDCAPEFHLADYTVRVREDVPIGTVVATVTANDLDEGNNGDVSYALGEGIGASGEGFFKIDKSTGTIRTAKQLDFEERQIYSLAIVAVDKGNPSLSSSSMLLFLYISFHYFLFSFTIMLIYLSSCMPFYIKKNIIIIIFFFSLFFSFFLARRLCVRFVLLFFSSLQHHLLLK